jgi:phosphoglycerate dehydrogenase-like enzyme
MKVVIAGRADAADVAALRAEHPGLELVQAPRDELTAAIADADGVYALGLTPEQFRAARRLRWVQSQGAGVEWIAGCPEVIASDVTVTNTRGAHAQTIAEHAFAMLLARTRGMDEFIASKERGAWARASRPLIGLSGMTMGIIGLGRIGNAVAQRAAGFDMRVVALDANDVPRPAYVERLWHLDGLAALLGESDVVTVAIPITAETRGLIGAAQLAAMRPGAFLLVMSRGGIVDEAAVATALHEGRLAGAGMDVFSQEPLPADSPLWAAPNLIITPHSSGSSRQTTALAWSIFAANVGRFVRGEPLENVVDKRRGY